MAQKVFFSILLLEAENGMKWKRQIYLGLYWFLMRLEIK